MNVEPEELVALLAAGRGTKVEKQAFFTERFGARVPRTNYETMWERLSDELGCARAARAVLQYVAETADKRVLRLVQCAAEGLVIQFRVREPAIVDVLFADGDELSTVGDALVDFLRPQERSISGPRNVRAADIVRREAATPTPVGHRPPPPGRATPEMIAAADVVLRWEKAEPKRIGEGPWRWTRCLYAYVHPADHVILYVGKTEDMTVRGRFVSNFQRKFHDLYARLNILKVDVIAADIQLRTSGRLTREWIDDLESLMIMRLQPRLNEARRRTRGSTRPGTTVVCTGAWPLAQVRFIDRG